MLFDEVYTFLIHKLETGLPAYLTYHNVGHTKNVIETVEVLAASEKIDGEELVLLRTAALFHDSGFLQHHEDHEELSCKLARKYLPDYDYTNGQIERICTMIMATKLPQTPADKLSELLCDADLYYIGGNQYHSKANRLFEEYRKFGAVKSTTEWDVRQLEFLSGHHYFTATAKRECDAAKKNIELELQGKLAVEMAPRKGIDTRELIQDLFLVVTGVILSGIALNYFLLPNHIFDGGVTGIFLLIQGSVHLDQALTIILLNLPFIVLSYFTVSQRFALWTFLSVALLGICLFFLRQLHVNLMSDDKLLMAVFGGVLLGIGIGLVMRAGAALDGIEVLALYTLKKTSFTITEIILFINILIFSIVAYEFKIETALYSILTYFAATRSIDYVVEGIQAYTGVTIISGKSDVIKYQLVNNLGRGITVYKGERGFLPGQFELSAECDIIFTVINRLELRKLKNLVYDVDPAAFVFANTIKEASGGIIKRRHKH